MLEGRNFANKKSQAIHFASLSNKKRKKRRMLPHTPTPLSIGSTTNDSMLRNYPYYHYANRLCNEAPEEVRGANMPAAVGALPLALRVGKPIATYKLNKNEIPHPNSDHVFLHMEHYCAPKQHVPGNNVWRDRGFLRDARTCKFHVNYDEDPSVA